MTDGVIYLDNAATTFPKPRAILEAMIDVYSRMGVSPGRGSYDLAVEAEDFVNQTRTKIARFFNAPDPNRVIFASNATDALNLAMQGLLEPGDHVVSTRLEHNSVLRPLYHLHERGLIEYDLVPFDSRGFIDPEAIAKAIRANTRLVIVCHASNVLGTVQRVPEIARVCNERNVPLLIDAAQSAGVVPIDMGAWKVSAIAFTGHKSMFGPMGIGGLAIQPELDVKSTRFGGTGVDSKSLIHTQTFPHRLEAGTINLLGVIGLSEGLDFVMAEGLNAIYHRKIELLTRLRDGLSALDRVTLYCQEDLSEHVGIITANVQGMEPADVGSILDADFGIAVRTGLHCAPLVHETLGTYPQGGVRFSLGPLNTQEDIDRAIEAMGAIARAG
jgi:cysteine desulfurase/selenocysteine lyase